MKSYLLFRFSKRYFMKSPHFWVIVVFNIIALLLISTWFKSHTMLATAEEGIPLYKSIQSLYGVTNIWQDISLGYASPFVFPLITLFGFTSLLQLIGLSSWLSQAILFFIYTLTGLISVYYLCKVLLKENFVWPIGLISGSFYLLNLYTYSQVWGRFIYSLFSLWAFLPLMLLLWIHWLQSYKLRYLFSFIITSIFFSCAFALPSSVLAIWTPIALFSFISILQTREKVKKILYSFSGLLVWVVCNIWWLYPLWIFRNGSSLGGLGGSSNIKSLQEVSRFFPLEQIILLKQIFLFGSSNFWSVFYRQEKPYLISLLIFIFMLVGIFVSRKYKSWSFLITSILISFFIIKGTNPPFGKQLYEFLFTHIPITQVLRNPYEKFGSVFLLPYAIFFGIFVGYITIKFKRLTFLLLGIFFAIFCVYLVQPMWNGDVFPGYVHVIVPSYYKLADKYIVQNTNGRILSLPFTTGSSVKFTWGYKGEEPAPYLFSRTAISNFIGVSPADKFYLLLQNYLSNKNFPHILSIMSTDSIVFHKDIELSTFYPYDFNTTEKFIEGWYGMGQSKIFGGITVYTLNKDRRLGEVYAINNLRSVDSLPHVFDTIVSSDFNPYTDGVILKSNIGLIGLNNFRNKFVAPKLFYTKISPNKYMIHISHANAPYILVLTESYHPMWQAKSKGIYFTKHILINGYANAWLIDKKGSYDVDLTLPVWPWN